MITAVVFLFSIFAIFEGSKEAHYFHYRWKSPMNFIRNEHTPFTILRAIVAIYATVIPILLAKWYGTITIVALACVFPFFHDGAYFYIRNKLDKSVFVKKWMDPSKSRCAHITLNPWVKLGLMLFGYVIAIGLDIWFTTANLWYFFG